MSEPTTLMHFWWCRVHPQEGKAFVVYAHARTSKQARADVQRSWPAHYVTRARPAVGG